MNCKKCRGECKPSKALKNSIISSEFECDIQITSFIDVLKCSQCGHSFVPEKDKYEEYERLTENRGNIFWTSKS